jgi:hypothetical protein
MSAIGTASHPAGRPSALRRTVWLVSMARILPDQISWVHAGLVLPSSTRWQPSGCKITAVIPLPSALVRSACGLYGLAAKFSAGQGSRNRWRGRVSDGWHGLAGEPPDIAMPEDG